MFRSALIVSPCSAWSSAPAVALFVAYPAAATDLPDAPWVGEACAGVDRLPTLDDQAARADSTPARGRRRTTERRRREARRGAGRDRMGYRVDD